MTENWVTVMEATDRLLIAMAKGILEDAGIQFYVSGEEISLRPGMVDAMIHRPYLIQVPRELENQARETLRLLTEPNASV